MRLFTTLLIAFLMLPTVSVYAQIYVDVGAPGGNNGSTWTDAYLDLQDALSAATNGDQIWVAAATYKPDSGNDRTKTFQLINGVEVYGGFAGGEVSLGDRDVAANVTILSGDIGVISDNSDNSYHVVTGSGTDATAIIDGFTVTGGNADGVGHLNGGGMLTVSGSPTVSRMTFTDNTALFNGGGMYNIAASPTIMNTTFFANNALQYGGGMGGVSSPAVLANVLFLDNSAVFDGGGVYNFSGSNVVITNCMFHGNLAANGGAIANSSSSPPITNTIVWGNTTTVTLDIHNAGISQPLIAHSLIEGSGGSDSWSASYGTDGGSNDDRNPAFVDEANDDFRLKLVSPGTNTGDNAAAGIAGVDFDGQPRISGGVVDMGLTEYQFVCYGGSRLYVKPVSTGTGDGSSWANATGQLRRALVIADACGGIDEIWVAAGTYKPTPTTDDRTWSFVMKSGLALYGGFAGTETSPSERDIGANPTWLTGSLGGPEEAFHVVISSGVDATAILDGFRVAFGAGKFLEGTSDAGGGVRNIGGSPTIRDVVFDQNDNGFHNEGGSPTFERVSFTNNQFQGLFNNSGGNVTLTDVFFQNNSGGKGGAIKNSGSVISISNGVFVDNHGSFGGSSIFNDTMGVVTVNNGYFEGGNGTAIRSWWEGGKLFIYDSTFESNTAGSGGVGIQSFNDSIVHCERVVFNNNMSSVGGGALSFAGGIETDITLIDVTFKGNSGLAGGIYSDHDIEVTNGVFNFNVGTTGGAVRLNNAVGTFLNCTFVSNSAVSEGGAVYYNDNAIFTNCIFWSNNAPAGETFFNDGGGAASFLTSLVEDSGGSASWDTTFGLDLGGNIDTDPLFVSGASDFHLMATSPAIDAGTNVANLPATDRDGFARVVGTFVDMGAYEFDPLTGIEDDTETPRYARQFSTYPNPFNPTLTVAFELEQTRQVDVTVFTVAGERVRTIVRGERSAGRHEFVWDARDASGRAVASGIYIVRIDTQEWRSNRKVVLLK